MNSDLRSPTKSALWRNIGAACLLLLLFAQALGAARAASITFDEGPHLAVGYTTLRTGDLRLQPVHIHPPLANVLAAAPLLLDPDLPDPRAVPGWEIASLSAVTDALIWQNPHPARLALAGRLPIILLALLAGAVVFRWAADLGGTKAGLLALGLYTLDPNVIAHGSLVTTDMAVTAWGLLALFLLYRHGRRPTNARLMGVGLTLGLALASKVSALLLVPLIGGVLILQSGRRDWRQSLQDGLIVATAAFLVLWAAYGFELRPFPAATHLDIYRSLQAHYRLGHPAFLIGQNSDQGWWYYFPVAFIIKTPLPTLILLGTALVLWAKRRPTVPWALALFPPIYLFTSLFSSVDIGYRHLLPVLPFIHIIVYCVLRIPGTAREGYAIRNTQYAIRFTLFAWLVLGTAKVHPFPLTFFNELAGGPQKGHRWLVDSNLDWGQNLWQLQDWMQAEGVERVYYSHFSPARPQVYGVTVDPLPPHPRAVPFAPWNPAPGVYVIGATPLQGVYTPDVNTFAWFRTRQPDAVLGHALFVYRQPTQQPLDWVAVCFGLPLSERQIRANLGQADLRLVYFDCAQSQVYPSGGAGRYLLPPEAPWPDNGTLALEARHPDGTPAYRLLRAGGHPTPEQHAGGVTIAGPLDWLGYRLERMEGQITLQTYWRVIEPPGRPLSLMAHLVTADGTPVAVGDGLGVPVEGWQPGDIIVQRHSLVVPPDTPPGDYWLQTGAYWLDSLERWPVRRQDGTIDDRLILAKIAISQ